MKEFSIYEMENIKIGHAQDEENATECTVILCEKGAPTGVDVRGGGPASRETELLNPVAASEEIHGILLSGGSAFGLDAAGGAMEYLEERGIGHKVAMTVVPLICTSCIFDLGVGNYKVRPNKEMAYRACENAQKSQGGEGNIGAGMGATVGKLYGPGQMMKAGIGTYGLELGELKVGAIVVVNALGDIYDPENGKKLAGLLNKQGNEFLDSEEELYKMFASKPSLFPGNTTIGAVITNGKFKKYQMKKIAAMAQNGYARTIRPVHTSRDGDSVYAMSVGDIEADVDVTGTLAAKVMAMAIKKAVMSTESIYGLKCAKDFLS